MRPVLFYDGECGFCRYWVKRLRARTGDRIEFVPFQDPRIDSRFPDLRGQSSRDSVIFREIEGRMCRAAEATFRVMEVGGWRLPMRAYRRVPGVAAICEAAYRFIARHRGFFGRFQHEP